MTGPLTLGQRSTLQDRLTRILASAATLEDAVIGTLETMGSALGWSVGMYWHRVPGQDVLHASSFWQAPGIDAVAFAAASYARTFSHGDGIPGEVWARREPLWAADIAGREHFPRQTAGAALGLRTSCAFPVTNEADDVVGVIELFHRAVLERDEEFLALCRDVGAQIGAFATRDRGERAVRESAALTLAILQSSLDCILTMDHQGRITEFNAAAERTFGYARAEVLGRTLAEVIIPPALREAHHRGMARYLVTGEARVLGRRIEVSAMRKDGSVFPCELAITRLAVAGPPVFAGHVRDLTERRRAEAALHFVAGASAALASSLDYRMTLPRVAQLAIADFCDWCVVELREGDAAPHFVMAAHRDPAKADDALALHAAAGSDLTYDPARVARLGVMEWVDEAAPPDEPGTPPGSTPAGARELSPRSFIIVPITARGGLRGTITFASGGSGRRFTAGDRVHAADLAHRVSSAIENGRLLEETQRARAAADVANRARADFLAMVSHELRTPLNAMGGYAQLLEMGLHGEVTAEQRNALARIRQSQEHLLGLIDNVLDFAKLEGGHVELVPTTVGVQGLVEEVELLVHPQLLAKQLTYEVMRGKGGAEVVADREKARQILVNLLSNAAKFTPAGGRITIGWRVEPAVVAITVADTGIGIAADRQQDIFEPFVQVDSALTRRAGGVGLGLAISRDIARAMGGDLVVRSEPGAGSTFTLTLPRAGTGETAGPPPAVRPA